MKMKKKKKKKKKKEYEDEKEEEEEASHLELRSTGTQYGFKILPVPVVGDRCSHSLVSRRL